MAGSLETMHRYLIVPLLLGLAGTTFAARAFAADTERSTRYVADAHYYMGKNDWDSALIQLRNALDADPQNARAFFDIGECQRHIGDQEAAERAFRKAADLHYMPPQVDAKLAEIMLQRDELGPLLEEIKPGNRPPELEAEVRSARGYALLGLQRAPDAVHAFKDALAQNPKLAIALVGLGQAEVITGQNDEAAASLTQATALDPSQADAWLLLGYLHMWRGDRAGARDPFDKAVAQNPKSEPARRARALYLIADHPDAAAADVAVLLKLYPNHPEGNLLDAAIKSSHGQLREASLALQNIRGIDTYAPALYLQARIDFAQGLLSEAESSLNQLLKVAPNDKPAEVLHAAVLLKRGNYAAAATGLENILSTTGEDRTVLSMLADAYAGSGNSAKAAAVLQRVAKAPAPDIDTRTNLALQQTSIGRFGDALQTLQTAALMGPLPSQSASLLVANYLEQKQFDQAWKAALTFRDQSQNSAESEVLLGVVALHRETPAVAASYFQRALALNPDLISAKIDLAGALRLQDKTAEAKNLLEHAANSGGQPSPEILQALANLAHAQKNTDEEISWLERTRSAAKTAVPPRLALVDLYLQRGQADKALAVALETSQIADDNPAVLSALGKAQLANQQMQNAITSFQKLAEVTQSSSSALMQLADAQLASGDPQDATTTLRTALDHDAGNVVLQDRIVDFATQTKQLEPFIGYVTDLTVTHPDTQSLYEMKGTLALKFGQPAEALSAFTRAQQLHPTSRATIGLAEAQAASGAPLKAVDILRDWLIHHPEDVSSRTNLARLFGALSRYNDAISEYEILTKGEKNPYLLNDLAWLYQKQGDSRALSTAQTAHRLAPDLAMIDDTLGWILLQNNDAQGALQLFQEATVHAESATQGMQYRLALAYVLLDRKPEARIALDKALKSSTSFEEAADARALRRKIGD